MLTRTQIIINKVASSLPITVFPEREILPQVKKVFKDEAITLRTAFEIHKMVDMLDEGGIVCEIVPVGVNREDLESAFLCSITHFRVKRGEPFFLDLEKYRMKRIRKLKREARR